MCCRRGGSRLDNVLVRPFLKFLLRKIEKRKIKKEWKGIEFLPQTQIFLSQYLCKLMMQTFDISNLDYFIYNYNIIILSINSLKNLRSTTLVYKDLEIRKSEFVAKTQFLSARS